MRVCSRDGKHLNLVALVAARIGCDNELFEARNRRVFFAGVFLTIDDPMAVDRVDLEVIIEAAEELAGEWAQKDEVAASQWITTLPAGDFRSRATVGLLEKITGHDPERALEWAKALPPGEVQTEQIGKVMRQWLPDDPYAAMRAVQSLPEEMRAEIWKEAE